MALTNAEKVRRYRAKHPDKARAALYDWRRRNPSRVLAHNRKAAGLPAPTRPCPQLCECCGNPPGKRSLAIDHDHVTGRFRGWLCNKCNPSIGGLGDNVNGLLRAVDYLLRNT